MNCVRYDPETFQVTGYGTISEESFAAVTEEGRPIISVHEFPDGFAIHLYDIDPDTKSLVLSPNPRPDPAAPLPELPERNRLNPLSDRQFFQKAALDGYITREDALAAVQTGFIPAPIQAFIDAMQDVDVRFDATMFFSGGTTFYRPHPLVEGVLMDFGLQDEEAMNAFFREAGTL